MADKSFAELGRTEAIRQLFEGTAYKPFEEPVSFDATSYDRIVMASRIFLEGIDFNLVYFPLKHLGYKSVIEVTGELYASMAHPQSLSVVLGVSAKLDFSHIQELFSGMTTAAREHGYKSVSLDLAPSRNGLTISVSACGREPNITTKRIPKPQSKDLICVSGSLGAAFFGLQVLEQERVRFDNGASRSDILEKNRMLVGSYLKPELNPQTVAQLEDGQIYPSTGYFVTRGLSDAVMRLCRDTGLGAKVYADKIPFEGNSFSLGKDLDMDPVSAAMNGGDDCRLLFTVPILMLEKFRHDFQTFDIIGHLALPDVGAVMVTPDGLEMPMKAQGWN